MIGKRIKLKPTPGLLSSSINAFLSSSKIFIVYEKKSHNSYSIKEEESGNKAGWVYDYEMSELLTLESIQEQLEKKKSEIKDLESKIDWIKRNGLEFFEEAHFKIHESIKNLNWTKMTDQERIQSIMEMHKKLKEII
jgi:hypothetical protein